jgi:hypothetical protein
MSSAWFSIREIADFFVRNFFAIISCVMPVRSLACRSITLNSNASYPDSKFSANFKLRFFRCCIYRSTSLIGAFSFGDIQIVFDEPAQFLLLEFFTAFL